LTFSRNNQINKLKNIDEYDLLIIGGGIVGAAALTIASNAGLNALLADKHDFASGASSRSTKLLHGGIRYLPQLQFSLVKESLNEQKILKKTLGSLYRPLKLLAPIYKNDGFADLPKIFQKNFIAPFAFKLGLIFYDFLGGRKKSEKHKNISKNNTFDLFPKLKKVNLKKSFIFQDAQTDDSKLVLSLLRTAVEINNSTAINYLNVKNILKKNKFYQIHLRCVLTGIEYSITAKKIIAASGVHNLPGDYKEVSAKLKMSGGAHLVLKGDPLEINNNGVFLPKTEDERVMFVLPWNGNTIVGTTDTEKFSGTKDNPHASKEEIDYLIRHVKKYFDIEKLEYISSWSGIRALIDDENNSTKKIMRGHIIEEVDKNFIQIAGGKLTGFRLIAIEALTQLFNKKFELQNIEYQDQIINYQNYYNFSDLDHSVNHYCVATPVDYLLRRTNISWFSEDNGKQIVKEVENHRNFQDIDFDSFNYLKKEGLIKN
jgi:glycerol-3-phosphate dehydrogenase